MECKFNSSKLIMIVSAVLILTTGFFGGMFFQKQRLLKKPLKNQANNQDFSRNRQFPGGLNQGVGMSRQGMGQNRPLSGQISAIDDKSITIKLTDGSSKVIVLTDTTKYTKSADIAKTDLKVGDQIGVFTSQATDQILTAQTIELK